MTTSLPKILVILGPTATGKSDFAVRLATRHNGEVVSADSRQVYRELDLISGKITEEEMGDVPHHMLSVYDPSEQYTVAQYKADTENAIDSILSRNKLPIICGGTGFYIQAIVDNVSPPEVKPNPKLRAQLAQKPKEVLFEELQGLDPRRAETIDPDNPHRLIRALEVAYVLGNVPYRQNAESKYDVLQIGIDLPDDILKERIAQRLDKRLRAGMIEEAQALHKGGVSYERMEALGLEARALARYLQGNISKEEMREEIRTKSFQYAKRQRTWFKRDERIYWFDVSEEDAAGKIDKAVDIFL